MVSVCASTCKCWKDQDRAFSSVDLESVSFSPKLGMWSVFGACCRTKDWRRYQDGVVWGAQEEERGDEDTRGSLQVKEFAEILGSRRQLIPSREGRTGLEGDMESRLMFWPP